MLLDRFVAGQVRDRRALYRSIFGGDQPMIVIPEESTVSLPRGFPGTGNSRSTCCRNGSRTTSTTEVVAAR